jgi:hypothetical protein
MGRGKGCIDLDEVERFGLDTTPSRKESRDMLAKQISHLLSSDTSPDRLLKEMIDNRDELLADESDDLAAEAGDLFLDAAYLHSKLLPLLNQAIALTCDSDNNPLIVQDEDYIYHLRETQEEREALCGKIITSRWTEENASPHGIWVNNPAQSCNDCQYMLNEGDFPVALLRAAQSTSANYLDTNENDDLFKLSANTIKNYLQTLSVEELRAKDLSDLTLPQSGLGEIAAPFISERIMKMTPDERVHWMATGDGDMFPTYVAQIKKEYGEAEDFAWPSQEELEAIYARVTNEYFSKYPTWNGRIIYPIFMVAHLWPRLLQAYTPGIDPFELATKTISSLTN